MTARNMRTAIDRRIVVKSMMSVFLLPCCYEGLWVQLSNVVQERTNCLTHVSCLAFYTNKCTRRFTWIARERERERERER